MSTATDRFFHDLAERGYEPLLLRADGTLRVDLDREHWYLEMSKGNVTVSRRDEPADTVIRTDKATFDKVAGGQSNALATLLRNEMMFEGEPALLVLLQKLFPWPAEGPTS